jgi:hypothetical protein
MVTAIDRYIDAEAGRAVSARSDEINELNGPGLSDNVTFTLTLPHCHSQRSAFLLSQDSGVQFGVTHTIGGYGGSFPTGVGRLPCCAAADG